MQKSNEENEPKRLPCSQSLVFAETTDISYFYTQGKAEQP